MQKSTVGIIVVGAAASVAVALALSGFGLVLLFERHVERRALAELASHLDQVIAGLERGGDEAKRGDSCCDSRWESWSSPRQAGRGVSPRATTSGRTHPGT